MHHIVGDTEALVLVEALAQAAHQLARADRGVTCRPQTRTEWMLRSSPPNFVNCCGRRRPPPAGGAPQPQTGTSPTTAVRSMRRRAG